MIDLEVVFKFPCVLTTGLPKINPSEVQIWSIESKASCLEQLRQGIAHFRLLSKNDVVCLPNKVTAKTCCTSAASSVAHSSLRRRPFFDYETFPTSKNQNPWFAGARDAAKYRMVMHSFLNNRYALIY